MANRSVAYLGLGSNLGDRLVALRSAVTALDDHPDIGVDYARGIASLYETSPVGGPAGQGPYLNSVIRIRTSLAPAGLLVAVWAVERLLGRERNERWDARTLDIDILFFDDVVLTTPDLVVPHPALHERRFVLEPLAEIAGDLVHPVLGKTVLQLAEALRKDSAQSLRKIAPANWARAGLECRMSNSE
jgi:2-amino-4-hydroxy-6-hydroxymethyldihydropteridine diphosphokinase